MGRHYSNPVTHFDKNFKVIIDREIWDNIKPTLQSGRLIYLTLLNYTDWSKTSDGIRPGIYGKNPKVELCYSLGRYATAFQAEVCAIHQNCNKIM